MTDQDITAMRADAAEAARVLDGTLTIGREQVAALAATYAERYARLMPRLLDEVERLQARERSARAADSPHVQEAAQREWERYSAEHETLREIVRAVALTDERQMTLGEYHQLRDKARAVMAGEGGTKA